MDARVSADGRTVTITVPMRRRHRGGRREIAAPAGRANWAHREARGNEALIRALAKAHRWARRLESGEFTFIGELAAAEGVNGSYMSRVLRLSLLAPDIVAAVLDGKGESPELRRLMQPLPVHWAEQRAELRNVPPTERSSAPAAKPLGPGSPTGPRRG